MITVFDLDDTLYDEIDFVRSGFAAVASSISVTPNTYFDFMWNYFLEYGSGLVFDHLIKTFGPISSVDDMIHIYRTHKPNIVLNQESINLLDNAKSLGSLALISDGNGYTQKNKFNALGLAQWIDYPVFTDLYGTKKPEPLAFEMVMIRFKGEHLFIYLSDNPKKDFFAPNALDWRTIRYQNPNGIYKEFASNAHYEITTLLDAIPILSSLKKEE